MRRGGARKRARKPVSRKVEGPKQAQRGQGEDPHHQQQGQEDAREGAGAQGGLPRPEPEHGGQEPEALGPETGGEGLEQARRREEALGADQALDLRRKGQEGDQVGQAQETQEQPGRAAHGRPRRIHRETIARSSARSRGDQCPVQEEGHQLVRAI
jgi:hypothetical protein